MVHTGNLESGPNRIEGIIYDAPVIGAGSASAILAVQLP